MASLDESDFQNHTEVAKARAFFAKFMSPDEARCSSTSTTPPPPPVSLPPPAITVPAGVPTNNNRMATRAAISSIRLPLGQPPHVCGSQHPQPPNLNDGGCGRISNARREGATFTVLLGIDTTLTWSILLQLEDDGARYLEEDGRCHLLSFIHGSGRELRQCTWCRPHAMELMDFFRKHRQFEVLLFAETKDMFAAAAVRRLLDPTNDVIDDLVSSDYLLKNVRLVRPLNSICLIEATSTRGRRDDVVDIRLVPWSADMRDDKDLEVVCRVLQSVVDNNETMFANLAQRYIQELPEEDIDSY